MNETITQFVVEEQPNLFFNFRNKPNTKGGSGILHGRRNYTTSYPTVKLIINNYQNAQYYVDCSLFEAPSTINDNNIKLSAHLLVEKDEEDVAKYYSPIRKLMEKVSGTNNNTTEQICQLKDCFILRTTNKNYEKELKRKRGKYSCTDKRRNAAASKKLCLGFTLLKKHGDQYERVRGPIYSECMTNKKKVVLEKLCTTYGSINGGDEVTSIVSGFKKNDTTVRIYEENEKGEVIWKWTLDGAVTFITENIITFHTPKYGREWPNEQTYEINCRMEIVRQSDGSSSEAVTFTYRNDRAKRFIKRKLDDVGSNYLVKFKELCSKMDKMPRNGELLVHDYKEEYRNGRTFLNDVIQNNDLEKIYYFCKDYDTLFEETSNLYGENLLHYACFLDKPQYIYPLIELGCEIWYEDHNDRTPLYIAVEKQHNNCIEKFRQIFRNPDNFPLTINNIKDSLKCYNGQNYTVLHLAITKNLKGLVEDMLRFCVKNDVDINDIEVLGYGNRILHLAVLEGLPDMAKIIMEIVPHAYIYRNYAGESAYNMKISPSSRSYISSKYVVKMINQLWENTKTKLPS